MNPQPTTFRSQRRKLTAAHFILLALFLTVCAVGLVSSAAHSIQEDNAAPANERVIDDKIPKHIPIKVTMKETKQRAFKDVKNEKWVRDFELEIRNTGKKPIYFLSLLIILPEITAPDGNNMGFSIHYGRSQLGTIKTKAESDDVPIQPGETYSFRFADIVVESWEQFRLRESKPNPKKLILYFQILSFGDATGFAGNEGTALPHAQNERSGSER